MPPKKVWRGRLRRKRAMKGHVPLRPGCSIRLPAGQFSWGTWHYCHVHKPNTSWGRPIEYWRAPRGSRQHSVGQQERFQHSTTDSIAKEEIKCLFKQEIVDSVVIQPFSKELAVPPLWRRGSLSCTYTLLQEKHNFVGSSGSLCRGERLAEGPLFDFVSIWYF